MASKIRTQIPRPTSRKRKPSVRPLPPRPKGELERLAVRRLAAMKYRLAGASYRVIAEKLTEDRARDYADAKGISVERAMKKFPHVSVRTAWDDVTAELEELRRETELQRADLMALENARLDQMFSKALSLFANGSVPAGRLAIATMGRRCLIVAGYASRSEPVSRYAAHASYAGSLSGVRLSQGRWVSVIRRALLLGNHDLQILSDGPAFGGRAGRVVRDHAGGFPVAGQHDFRGGRAARRAASPFGHMESTLVRSDFQRQRRSLGYGRVPSAPKVAVFLPMRRWCSISSCSRCRVDPCLRQRRAGARPKSTSVDSWTW